jgi:hypothetical protein
MSNNTVLVYSITKTNGWHEVREVTCPIADDTHEMRKAFAVKLMEEGDDDIASVAILNTNFMFTDLGWRVKDRHGQWIPEELSNVNADGKDEGSPCMIAHGDIHAGFTFVGPFFDFEAADTWAMESGELRGAWEIITLERPDNN